MLHQSSPENREIVSLLARGTTYPSVLRSCLERIEAFAEHLATENAYFTAARVGKLAPATHAAYLASIHHIVAHTVPHLELGSLRAGERRAPKLQAFLRQKALEEAGHDAWAKEDLDNLIAATGVATPVPLASAERLCAFLTAQIDENPYYYLAYIMYAESLAVIVGGTMCRWVAQCGPWGEQSLTIVARHVELDEEHVADDIQCYPELAAEGGLDDAAFIHQLERAIATAKEFYDELGQLAARQSMATNA